MPDSFPLIIVFRTMSCCPSNLYIQLVWFFFVFFTVLIDFNVVGVFPSVIAIYLFIVNSSH